MTHGDHRDTGTWQALYHEALRHLGAPGFREVHFCGIGGVGMAGLAFLMHGAGFTVDGCDAAESPVTAWLREKGIEVQPGHDPTHVAGATRWVIRSPAVPPDLPELEAARQRGMPVIERGAVLPAWLGRYARSIAVGGTHGKTTTACMVLHSLQQVEDDNVAFAIGGRPAGCDGVAGGAGSELFVVEADESDGSLVLYEPTVAVITHAELDHVDYFRAPDAMDAVYRRFASQAKHAAILPVEAKDRLAGEGVDTRTFGLEAGADYRATEVAADGPGAMTFLLHAPRRDPVRVRLTAGGAHNVSNALAALAALDALGLDLSAAAASLDGFRLPARRFEVAAEARGITVVSDYAHHPTEIAALIDQARQLNPARLIGVFQPHRYSRTLQFADRFSDTLAALDRVHLVPVYSASEPFIEGGTSEDLLGVMHRRGVADTVAHASLEAAWDTLRDELRDGDLLLVIGAGDVDRIAAWAAAWLEPTS